MEAGASQNKCGIDMKREKKNIEVLRHKLEAVGQLESSLVNFFNVGDYTLFSVPPFAEFVGAITLIKLQNTRELVEMENRVLEAEKWEKDRELAAEIRI